MKNSLIVILSFPCLWLILPAKGQDRITINGVEMKAKDVSIDSLFEAGKLWNYTDATLEADWKDKGFKWNSASVKDRGIVRRENWGFGLLKISAFTGTQNVEEVSFNFKSGKLSEVSIAIWNKGDSKNADISEKDFGGLVNTWSSQLDRVVAPKYEDRGRDTASAAKAERRMWVGAETLAQLEFSGGKEKIRDPYTGREKTGKNFQGEFIRLRLLPKPSSTIGLNTSTGGGASVKRADLAKSVVREPSGDVFIPNVPMVDQGDKGYCAVATAARLFNYYGVPADQHEMAQIVGNQAGGGGTNPDEMEDAMKKISGKYKTRFLTEIDLDYSKPKIPELYAQIQQCGKKTGQENPRYR